MATANRIPSLVPILAAWFLLCVAPSLAAEDERQGLAAGEGLDRVLEHCVICHSSAIILQNHMTREGWDATLTRMQRKNGMWGLEENVRRKILDYLEKFQGPGNPTHSRQTHKMYPYVYPPNPL